MAEPLQLHSTTADYVKSLRDLADEIERGEIAVRGLVTMCRVPQPNGNEFIDVRRTGIARIEAIGVLYIAMTCQHEAMKDAAVR